MTVLALDLGEDQIAAGITDDEGRVTRSKQVPSLPGSDPDAVFEALASLAVSVMDGSADEPVRAIGVAVSGPRPSADGRVSPAALPSWVDYPLVARLQEGHPSARIQVHAQGDCFAMAERVQGAARGSARVLGVLLNGNVDGGLLLDGRLVPGAAQLGHVVVDPVGPICGCGGIGCLAGVARGAAVVGWAREHGWVAGAAAGPGELAASARAGDPVAGAALAQAGSATGVAIASVAALLDLDVVVVGGALADSGDVLMGPLRRAVERHLWLPYGRQLDVLGSVLGPHAGLVGAAALVLAG